MVCQGPGSQVGSVVISLPPTLYLDPLAAKNAHAEYKTTGINRAGGSLIETAKLELNRR